MIVFLTRSLSDGKFRSINRTAILCGHTYLCIILSETDYFFLDRCLLIENVYHNVSSEKYTNVTNSRL